MYKDMSSWDWTRLLMRIGEVDLEIGNNARVTQGTEEFTSMLRISVNNKYYMWLTSNTYNEV